MSVSSDYEPCFVAAASREYMKITYQASISLGLVLCYPSSGERTGVWILRRCRHGCTKDEAKRATTQFIRLSAGTASRNSAYDKNKLLHQPDKGLQRLALQDTAATQLLVIQK